MTKIDLRDADLSPLPLGPTRSVQATLTGAKMRYAEMARADLSKAVLAQADLSGADLTGARLAEADLTGAMLDRATGLPVAAKVAA